MLAAAIARTIIVSVLTILVKVIVMAVIVKELTTLLVNWSADLKASKHSSDQAFWGRACLCRAVGL